jgi:putative DNA primase/helicase
MKENFYQFQPTHTLILATNKLPNVLGDDHAIWRRVRLVRFDVLFWTENDKLQHPERVYPAELQADPLLGERLHDEAEGVLADMVANAVEFYANEQRLRPPPTVAGLTREYRESEDNIGQFLRGWQADPDRTWGALAFYQQFEAWFKGEIDTKGRNCPTLTAFGKRATKEFGKPPRTARGIVYHVSQRPLAG